MLLGHHTGDRLRRPSPQPIRADVPVDCFVAALLTMEVLLYTWDDTSSCQLLIWEGGDHFHHMIGYL